MRLRWSQRSAIAVCVLCKQPTTLPQHLVWLVFDPVFGPDSPASTLFSDRSTALFADRTGTFDGFPLSLPWPAGLPSFTRIGPRLRSMLRLGISSASPCSA